MTQATIENVFTGTKLIADGGFTCIPAGHVCEVFEDDEGDLWVACSDGVHYLDGQLDDDSCDYVGFFVMETEIQKFRNLLERWNTDEGRPGMGKLIDMGLYDHRDPNNISCMCAQGQALHVLAGWTPEVLDQAEQEAADRAFAELFGISRIHAVLLRNINDSDAGAPSVVITNPEKVLGDNARTVLAFWLYLDVMTDAQWAAAGAAAGAAAWGAAWGAAAPAARAAARAAAGATAWATAGATVGDAAWATAGATARASNEIQGATVMRERGQPFFFLPLFGFSCPEEIPPLPADYAKGLMETDNG